MELVVLSKVYTRTIIVYMCSEQQGKISENKIDPEQRDTPNPVSYVGNLCVCVCVLQSPTAHSVLSEKIFLL